MYAATHDAIAAADMFIAGAAVADYRPAKPAEQKIKKNDASFSLDMTKTKDIALEFGKIKKEGQLSVGFALETNNEEKNAIFVKKIVKRNHRIKLIFKI